MKRSHQAEEVLKEDYQAFGTIIAKVLTLDEAFQYPVTSVPLSITTLDGDLRQSKNMSSRNFFIVNSNATTNSKPQNAS